MRAEFFHGRKYIRIQSPEPESIINAALKNGISLYNLNRTDPITTELSIDESDMEKFAELCRAKGAEPEILCSRGPGSFLKKIRGRLSLLIFLLLLLGLICLSSFFVWDIKIICDRETESSVLLNELKAQGLYCGSFRPSLDTDRIRTHIMCSFPEISWLSININGSRAEVLLRFKEEIPEIYNEREPVNVIASRSGIIKSTEILNGIPQKFPGDTVEKDELLILGEQPGLNAPPEKIHARGRVEAETIREYSALSPKKVLSRGKKIRTRYRLALKFGNKRQNFYFYTGRDIDGCVKIIEEYNLGIDGLFSTPLSLIVEKLNYYEMKPSAGLGEAELREILLRKAAGLRVLDKECIKEDAGDFYKLSLKLRCLEDIALAVSP